MSSERDVTRIVRSWLRDDAHESADRVLDAVLDQLDTTPQRRSTWLARRLTHMNTFAKLGVAAAAVVIAAIVGLNVIFGSSVGGPGPEAPSVAPTPTPPRLDEVPVGLLEPGRYEIDQVFPVRLSLTLPERFTHGRGVPDDVGIHWNGPGSPRGLEFQIVGNVYADPCRTSQGFVTPPVGETVEELVDAMRALPGFQAGPVEDVTVGGRPATAFDLTNSIDAATCDDESIAGWQLAGGDASSIGSGQRQRIYVMDVAGERLVIMTYHFVESDAAEAVEMLQDIVDSIEFVTDGP